MYRGRFAPSPSGPLHFGSLVAAVASYLQAKAHQGDWLVRIEDVDTQRNIAGADKAILNTLEAFGFMWQDAVVYQSERSAFYEAALAQLNKKQKLYACDCSRKAIMATGHAGDYGIRYNGKCSKRGLARTDETALRIIVNDADIAFTDQVYGAQRQNLKTGIGDFHLLRRDQCYAYHLAVVVDDHLQGITEVVRGYDLLESTARHIYLQNCLGYQTPRYLHTPLAVDAQGTKLSKQTFATALDSQEKIALLFKALDFLGQRPEKALLSATIDEFWQWAIAHWQVRNIPRRIKQQTT